MLMLALKYLIILVLDSPAALMLSPKMNEDGPNRKETIVRRSFDREIKYVLVAAYTGKTNRPSVTTNNNRAIRITDMTDKINIRIHV
jgi:hypothetical protein